MPREPVDLNPRQAAGQGELMVWSAIRSLAAKSPYKPSIRGRGAGEFTRADVEKASRCSKETVNTLLQKLLKGGYVEKLSAERFKRHKFCLIQDVGVEPPRLNPDGSPAPESGQQRMWRAARILKSFTPQELAAAASSGGPSVTLETAKSYCRMLAKAKYLVGGPDTWTLVRQTGPLAPMIQKAKQVYDPNLGQVVHCPCGGPDAK